MRSAAQAIVAGDWRRRIPETGADDELDHLARTFNLMFERIELLLEAHKAVGAAVAHDLRRPLTRMAQRLETQLGREATRPETAAALEAAIADIHAVLATFNAILRIGQIESGRAAPVSGRSISPRRRATSSRRFSPPPRRRARR